MTSEATRMRDAGRSWTEVADRLGVTVAEAKAAVQEDKKARREGLSKTPQAEDRNGLRDLCSNCDMKCSTQSMRKAHADFTGECEGCTCDEYVYHKRQLLPWYRLPKDDDPHYVEPDVRLSGNIRYDALSLGVQKQIARYYRWHRHGDVPSIPQPSLETLVRRAKKKLKKGKKLRKHYDRPKGDDRW